MEQLRPSSRSAPLDGLRALAALSVLVFHVWLYRDTPPPNPREALTDKFLFELNLGLILFFVLSGFLLYQAFARASIGSGKSVAFRDYARRRAARIVPAYYVNLAGCLLLFWLVGLMALVPQAEQLPLFAVFGQNFSPDTVMKLNPVTWTLSVEMSLYLLLPLIGFAALRFGPKRVATQVLFLLALIGLTLAWNALVLANDWSPIGRKVIPAFIGHFALGMLGALWFERRRRDDADPLSPGATAAVFGAGMAFVFLNGYWHESGIGDYGFSLSGSLLAALGFALMIVAAISGSGLSIGWLNFRPLVAIGVVSYGLYLWHLPLLLAARRFEIFPDAFAPRLAVVLMLSLTAAVASWKLVEEPLIRRFSSGRKPAKQREDRQVIAPDRVAVADAS